MAKMLSVGLLFLAVCQTYSYAAPFPQGKNNLFFYLYFLKFVQIFEKQSQLIGTQAYCSENNGKLWLKQRQFLLNSDATHK